MKLSTQNIYKLGMAVLVTSLLGFFSACTGPEGPMGKDGANGVDGQDGTAKCASCHGDDVVEFLMAQYHLSKHNTGVIWEEEAGRIQCGGCHSGDGFAEAAKLGQNDPVSKATSKINCSTCHEIHEKFDSTDFKLRITSGFALRHTGEQVDFKEGNTCAKCHQARAFVHTTPADTIKPASKGATYSRFGPHYGTPANVMAMKGLEPIEGSTPIPTTNPHGNLAKGCVSCHMGSDPANPAVGGHTFHMPTANLAKVQGCTGCHDENKIKTAPNAAINAGLLAEYRQLLINRGWIDTTQALQAGGYNVLGEYFATPDGKNVVFTNPNDVKAVLNYLFIAKDRSRGIHNPGYVQAILKNGIEYLKQ